MIEEELRKWVVNDYFTPNIKAEVMLDTLLTPYIEKLVEKRMKVSGVCLVAKEMSIFRKESEEDEHSSPNDKQKGDRGPKVDYVLASPDKVYLVELKTTERIDEGQARIYNKYCKGKKFGEVLGQRLLHILDKPGDTFTLHLMDDKYKPKWLESAKWNDNTLKKAFETIMNNYHGQSDEKSCAKKAMHLIWEKQWAQKGNYPSRKYLYTLGQLVDYLNRKGNSKCSLWDKAMEVIYLTPRAGDEITISGKSFCNIDLKEFASLCDASPDDDYARMLSGIIDSLYSRSKTFIN